MMKRALSSFVISLAAITANPAIAQSLAPGGSSDCSLRIDGSPGNWIIQGYDPFSGNASIGTYDVMFVNDGGKECRFYPIFETDGSPFGLQAESGRRVPYTLLDTYGQYDATPLSGRTLTQLTHRAVVIAPHAQQLVRYVMNVAADSLPGDGDFTQRLLLNAVSTSGAPLTERQVIVGIDVIPSATLGLAGAFTNNNGRADIDLGDLAEGTPAIPLQLHVQSTRRYQLEVDSLNDGKLRMAGTEWVVPYQILIDGRLVRLGSKAGYSSARRSGMRVESLPIAFRIGDVSNKRAGAYSDVLTISVSVD